MSPRDSSRSSSDAGLDLWADTAGSGIDLAPDDVPPPAWKSRAEDESSILPHDGDANDRSSFGLDSHGDIDAALRRAHLSRLEGPRTRWKTDAATQASEPTAKSPAAATRSAASPQSLSRGDAADETPQMTLAWVLVTVAGLSLLVLGGLRIAGSIGPSPAKSSAVTLGAAAKHLTNIGREITPVSAKPAETLAPVNSIAPPAAPAFVPRVEISADEDRVRRLLHSIRVETSKPETALGGEVLPLPPAPPMPPEPATEPAPPPAPRSLPPELVRLSSPRAESLLVMAREFESLGRTEPALRRYREIIDQHPGTQAAAEAAARIAALERADAPPTP